MTLSCNCSIEVIGHLRTENGEAGENVTYAFLQSLCLRTHTYPQCLMTICKQQWRECEIVENGIVSIKVVN